MHAKEDRQTSKVMRSLVLVGAALAATSEGVPQNKSAVVPDAQVEANVLRALAADGQLADQQISSAAVYGVVTLTGHVRDEATRSLAEDRVSRTAGVQKVVDELTIASQTAAASPSSPIEAQGSNPQLQSDGSLAPSPDPQNGGQPPVAQPQSGESAAQSGYPPQVSQPGSSSAPPSPDGQAGPPPAPSYGTNQPAYGPPNQSPDSQPGQTPYGQPPYPQAGQPPYGQGQSQPPNGRAGQPPYDAPSQPPYGQQNPYARGRGAYLGQPGGRVVSVPAGTPLQLRMNEGIDSRHSQIGSTFSGTVIRDVVAEGQIAIPRGATVQGTVVDATKGGSIKGHATLALQVTQVTLGGRVYPLTSTIWQQDGPDKTGRTVGSVIGLGVVGALIGGVAGGGAGAAIGAGAGGAAGIGASAASGGPQVFLPPEAVIAFQISQPVSIVTVSQAEMEWLGYGISGGGPPQVRRRYPPPPPYYYGPGYYYGPRAYYRPYPY